MKNAYRWTFVVTGCLIYLFAGVIYAWSVISSPIADEFQNWTAAQLSTTFSIVMITFCIGSTGIGFLAGKVRPYISLWFAAALFTAGFYMSARTTSPITLYIGFGVLCGIASGITYNVVLSTATNLFPEKQGFISGVLLMAFALGSFILGKVYQAYTPDAIGAWRDSFIILGIVTAAVIIACSFFYMRIPDTSALPKAAQTAAASVVDVRTVDMLKGSKFWFFYIWAIVMTACGLVMIAQASGMATEVSDTLSANTIATVVGLISVFNGVGRIFVGKLFDRLGRNAAMIGCCVLFILTAFIMLITLKLHNVALLVAGFAIAGLGYSCISPSCSAYAKASYGIKYYPVNYPLITTNMAFSSPCATLAASLFDRSGSYVSTLLLIIAFSVVGIAGTVLINIVERRNNAA